MMKYGREYSEDHLIFGEPVWFFNSIWGTKILHNKHYNNLKEFLDALPQVFFIYKDKDSAIITTWESRELWKRANWIPISNYDSYLIFGLPLMEDACEKTYSVIDLSTFYKKTRKIKINKLKTNKHE